MESDAFLQESSAGGRRRVGLGAGIKGRCPRAASAQGMPLSSWEEGSVTPLGPWDAASGLGLLGSLLPWLLVAEGRLPWRRLLLSQQPKTFLHCCVVQPVCSVLGILSLHSETIQRVKGSVGWCRPLTSPTPAGCLLPPSSGKTHADDEAATGAARL